MTQFEADTATAFVALAAAGVEVGVIEAGLGGRLDATNVLPSRVTALTSVGLEHTEYLGDTEVEIAAEKLAVLRDHSTLVIGPLAPDVEELARRVAAERSARAGHVRDLAPARRAAGRGAVPAPQLRGRARGRRGDARLARRRAGAGVAAGLELHGRMEVVEGDPSGARRGAQPGRGGGARGGAARGRGRAAGGGWRWRCSPTRTRRGGRGAGPVARGRGGDGDPGGAAGGGREAGGPGAWRASRLADLAREAGLGWVEEVAEPAAAVERARSVARAQGGVALVTGSHYLLRYATYE